MDLLTLLEMVSSGMGDRTLIGRRAGGITGSRLRQMAAVGGSIVSDAGVSTVVYLGGNGPAFPVALFSAAVAHTPFLPLNYRLSDEQLSEIIARQDSSLLITDDLDRASRIAPATSRISLADFVAQTTAGQEGLDIVAGDADEIAVLLMTSGTTAAPKSAVLRHSHLTSYILGSVEYASAEDDAATIVSVPPYHIAAVANLLSNLYAGRRIVYLDQFTPRQWLDTVIDEEVTNAMVVPTMLSRIVRELLDSGDTVPGTLRAISYGGAKVTASVVREALRLFPETGFVNAYGLTETSSTIAVLGPEDHRAALASDDPSVQARLGSVGRALPGVEIEIHDELGSAVASGTTGYIMVRGPQVAGEYLEGGSRLDKNGWFPTKDRGRMDDEGFIFVEGRADDTIIRGGENIAPAEIEEVILDHPGVLECAVAGIPDEEWGQRIAAFVVLKASTELDSEELRAFVRGRLRSSKTPDFVTFLPELPETQTGKILRRVLVSDFTQVQASA